MFQKSPGELANVAVAVATRIFSLAAPVFKSEQGQFSFVFPRLASLFSFYFF
jgi:hypothetical protein